MAPLKRLACGIALTLLTSAVFSRPAPNVTIELRELDPAGATVLPPYTPVYGRIAYHTDGPVRLALRPYRNGRSVEHGVYYSGSPSYPGPTGEAVAWFAFDSPQAIDEIRAIANDAVGTEFASATATRRIAWSNGVTKPPVAAWVAPLQARAEALGKSQTPVAQSDLASSFITQLMIACVPLSVILQVLALRKLAGRAQRLARFSALAMGALWLFVIVTAVAGSNLSPIWLLFVSPFFVLFLSMLLVARLVTHRRLAA